MATTVLPLSSNIPYNPSDEILLNPSVTLAHFDPTFNNIEYTIATPDESFKVTFYNYSNYSFPTEGVTSGSISDIILNPSNDLTQQGYSNGEFNVYYNFFKNELSSSFDNRRFFIKDISGDRTEVTLSIPNPNLLLIDEINTFKTFLEADPDFFQDFYLNFGSNVLSVANNIAIDDENFDILVNLYSPLPDNIQVKNNLWIVTQIADELAFNITFTPDRVVPTITSFPIKGPNFNISGIDQTNNSSEFQTYSTLITSSLLSTSYSQLNNLISSSGIQIGVDYTDFSNFVHFSSAATRINNFISKVELIEQYSASIAYTSSNFSGKDTTTNTSILTNQINNIIENFDGYEYYLYFGSGSWTYPKSTNTVPYTLYPTSDSNVINWLGNADNLTGILGSASIYDQSNLDYLYNVIPTYIQEDPQNDPYKLFVDMVAQHYDNIWIYYKDVTNRYNADNRLDSGISKDLVANALKSFGIKLYQNNFSTNDLYSAFLGYGSNVSSEETITSYITASYDASVMPLDDVNKETYKRLYHNLPYLAKTKGTIPGLRALINCFGIPDTILRISEFGGRDKDTSTYDYFDQKYNYAYYRSGSSLNNHIRTPFRLNSNWNAENNAPESIQFRFKPSNTFPPTEDYQVLLKIGGNSMPPSGSVITLEYNGSGYTSASYGGSTYSSSFQYGILTYYPSIDLDSSNETYTNTASLYLPFFNGEWWSVMLNRSGNTYTLFAGSKGYYDGYDGNQILYLNSASVDEPINNTPFSGSLSSFISFPTDNASRIINLNQHFRFEGYLQELRYWSKTGSAEAFKDFIMNPSSIDTSEEENNYADYLAFRAPLGNELNIPTVGNSTNTSVHPKVTGSWETTSSFSSDSSYSYLTSSGVPYSFLPNVESFFYDQPIAGIKNRVTDKIQIVSSSYPTGSVLSQYRSLEQTYPTLGSETPDINLLEVAFSPQNEINNDIISSLGYFNIGEYIGDPRQTSSPNYPDLNRLSNDFFQKYFASYDLFDYIRLIKYFDNSLFKMIQDFVPARTSLASGVVIKQHLLERSKYPEPQVEWQDVTYSGSVYSQQKWNENISGSYTETSIIGNIFGGTGGTFDSYNFSGSTLPPTFINNTQSWYQEILTPSGALFITRSDQSEFYNGELEGTNFIAEDGELNPNNLYKYVNRDAAIKDWSLTGSGGTLDALPYPPGQTPYGFASINYSFADPTTYIATPETIKINEPTITPIRFTASMDIIWITNSAFTSPSSVVQSAVYWTRKDTYNLAFNDNVTGKRISSTPPSMTISTFPYTESITISGSWTPSLSEVYNLIIAKVRPASNVLNYNRVTLRVENIQITTSQVLPPSNSTLPSYQLANYNIFNNSDYNAIINNEDLERTSQYFMDVDYSTNAVTPINQSNILNGDAVNAPIQDSNYTSYAWSNIRYRGSKYNSIKI
jgi:hypothetical protein